MCFPNLNAIIRKKSHRENAIKGYIIKPSKTSALIKNRRKFYERTQTYSAVRCHVAAGADMVDFGGWEMPIQYPTGIVAEHLYTRHACGLFDVSTWAGCL